jgi:hypothetical protein
LLLVVVVENIVYLVVISSSCASGCCCDFWTNINSNNKTIYKLKYSFVAVSSVKYQPLEV